MTIQYKHGCLIEALRTGEVQAIAHQANCQNTMGSGVAKAIREAYPQAYEADCQTIRGDYSKLGSLSWVLVPTEAPEGLGAIFNLYGQFNYGREPGRVYTDTDALFSAITTMKLFLDAMGMTKVGLPKLGAGQGGAAWDDIEAIINEALDGYDVTVYVKE